jgi:Tfp pilus assembly protein PilN
MSVERLQEYLKPAPRRQGWSWVVLAALLCAAAWCAVVAYRQYQELVQQEHEVAQLRRARHVEPPPTPTRADVETQRQWDNLRRELDFSWYPIFAALEHASNPNIALLEFIPDKSEGRLVLRGSARNIDELSAYLDALSSEAAFREVYLAHQKKVQQGAVETIAFEVRMRLLK